MGITTKIIDMELNFRAKGSDSGEWHESGNSYDGISQLFYALDDGQLDASTLQQYNPETNEWKEVS